MSRLAKKICNRSTGVLLAMQSWLDQLPLFVMSELRAAIKDELLARELAGLAKESGGYPCVAPGGVQ